MFLGKAKACFLFLTTIAQTVMSAHAFYAEEKEQEEHQMHEEIEQQMRDRFYQSFMIKNHNDFKLIRDMRAKAQRN